MNSTQRQKTSGGYCKNKKRAVSRKGKSMDEISISIDCYGCGTKLETKFRLFINNADYIYCPSCQEGVQIYFNGVLHIDRLVTE